MIARKYIRIALTPEDQQSFAEAKEKSEKATGICMTDSMFALSLLRRAVKILTQTG